MMFFSAGRLATLAVAVSLATIPCAAQSTASGSPGSNSTAKPASPKPGGTVIFSRSIDANGNTVTESAPAPVPATAEANPNAVATDPERKAVTMTGFDMDVHLHTAAHEIEVRALVTVRNDGAVPLAHIPLQLSSSLHWDQVRLNGRNISFPVARINTDVDHTGQLNEAAIPLSQPLAPGASLNLDVNYSGVIAESARRLVALGAPDDQAAHTDWDRIDTAFTGLRGFGNVVWYPVCSVPVLLGDGARLFQEIGEHKQRLAGAHFKMHLTVEFPPGDAPDVALVNGHPAALSVPAPRGLDASVAGVVTAATGDTTLAFQSPSLFVAIRKAHAGTNMTAWTTPENEASVESWVTESAVVSRFVARWLGPQPRAQLTLLDLPDPDDAPFATGAMLAVSLQAAQPAQIDPALVHALGYAWMQSPHAWLNEGVAFFMNTLWTEKEHGRDRALEMLEAERPALALAEPSSPGEGPGQPLPVATLPIYYRAKAAYVFWMLRDLAGDATLSAALKAYNPAHDPPGLADGAYFEHLLTQSEPKNDLAWFFADWVKADKGLPDLSVRDVYPSPAQAGTWLVAVTVENSGYAAADVPVTLRTGKISLSDRMLVPARGRVVKHLVVLARPAEAQVNDGTVPETEASVHITHLESSAAGAPSP